MIFAASVGAPNARMILITSLYSGQSKLSIRDFGVKSETLYILLLYINYLMICTL